MTNGNLTILLLALINFKVASQPELQWQRCFGGSEADEALSIKQANDGSLVVAGSALSANGGVTNNKGVTDFWAIKVDKSGNLIWQKTYGGTNHDRCYSSDLTDNGGVVLAGQSSSNNINVSGNHGDIDGWVVKLDSVGAIQWQKCLGGSSWDEIWSVQYTTDGGYVAAGRTASSDGDVVGHHGSFDYWVVKLSSSGTIEWQRSLGGSLLDIGYVVKQAHDGGYIVAGESNSVDGDCSGLHGSTDLWVVKLSPEGELEWQKMLGGSSLDWAFDVSITLDGGYAILGQIGWNDGDISEYFGGFDIWLVKINSEGEIEWEKTFGGSGDDYIGAILEIDNGGYIVAGATQSIDGHAIGNDGGQDLWVFKVDSIGSLLWQKTLGGSQGEWASSLTETLDGGLAIAGYARSNNGDVSGNHGSTDFWIVKLAPETSSTTTPTAIPLNLYPNPAQNWFRLNLPITESDMHISIIDAQGRVVLAKTIRSDERLDISALEPGVYSVTALARSGQVYAGKLVKN
jgi:hypothetical protein